jgi:outer membrane protein assembly factor BamB
MDGRVYIQNTSGKGAAEQERIMCFNADSGKLLWEHRFNVYLSDVPPHRVGWASPVGDPATGNVYVLGVGGTLSPLIPRGQSSLNARSVKTSTADNPWRLHRLSIIDGIPYRRGDISMGPTGARAHRFMAFDKRTGETVWAARQRPTYAHNVCGTHHCNVNGTRLLIFGEATGGPY